MPARPWRSCPLPGAPCAGGFLRGAFRLVRLHHFRASPFFNCLADAVTSRISILLGRRHRDEADGAIAQRNLEPITRNSCDMDEVPAMDLADYAGGTVGLLVNRGVLSQFEPSVNRLQLGSFDS